MPPATKLGRGADVPPPLGGSGILANWERSKRVGDFGRESSPVDCRKNDSGGSAGKQNGRVFSGLTFQFQQVSRRRKTELGKQTEQN